mgnify:CR=1 FL=1
MKTVPAFTAPTGQNPPLADLQVVDRLSCQFKIVTEWQPQHHLHFRKLQLSGRRLHLLSVQTLDHCIHSPSVSSAQQCTLLAPRSKKGSWPQFDTLHLTTKAQVQPQN